MTETELARLGAHIAARLGEQREEIEATLQERVYTISDPGDIGDPTYVESLQLALSAAFDYVLSGLEGEGDEDMPAPATLLVQARLAARSGVSLDTVLRRYFSGYTLLGDLFAQEAGKAFPRAALQELMRAQAMRFDRLVAAISEEHSREWERPPGSSEERRVKQVEDLLGGEAVDGDELEYDFDHHHLGLIAVGPDGGAVVRQLTLEANCRLLLVSRDERSVWAWFGARHEVDPDRLVRIASDLCPAGLLIALGEPAQGLEGWRLTHQQASASLPIAIHNRHNVVRYADVALLASILSDKLFAKSLRELFIAPLMSTRDGGASLLETLHAYFAAERNVSSAAIAIGVSRQTVINRLNAVEVRLRRPLGAFAAEMEAALRLEEFDHAHAMPDAKVLTAAPLQPVESSSSSLDTLHTSRMTSV